MANKEISDFTEFTSQPDPTDLLLFERLAAEVTRGISYFNLVKDWWITKTAAYTAVANNRILANTTTAAFTIKLPAAPTAGDTIRIADSHGKWNTNNLTVGRNGKKIRGAASDATLSTQWQKVTFVYIDATIGWIYY